MNSRPRLDYTVDARRDLQRCRKFLRRNSPGNVSRRLRELMNGVRAIQEFPEMNRVRLVEPDTALPIRRHNVGQFVIAYVYFKPDEVEPRGVISLRAFRHASMQDALWAVREGHAGDSPEPGWTFLSTRPRSPFGGYCSISTYGEITFTPNDPETPSRVRRSDGMPKPACPT